MRHVDLSTPCSSAADASLLARLTRHLDARLHDLAENWPEVLEADQTTGIIRVRFPDRRAQDVQERLEHSGILLDREGDCVLFRLSLRVSFEDLDHVWGELFSLL